METTLQPTTMPRKTNLSVADIGEKIISLYGTARRNLIVGISGRGGSGKSTLANKLVEYFQGNNISVLLLTIDSFVFPTTYRNRNPNAAEARYNDTYDFATLINTIVDSLRVRTSINREVLHISRASDTQVLKNIEFTGPGIVLVEGVHLFRQKHSDAIDYKIWIELSFEEGLARAVARSNHLGAGMTAEQIRHMYVNRSAPGHALYVKRDDPIGQSDITLNGILTFD